MQPTTLKHPPNLPKKSDTGRSGIYWSFIAFGIVGLSGIALNQVVVNYFGLVALGRYNTLLAITLIGGQLGSASLHSSVLYHTPKASTDGHPTGQILVSALKLTLASSFLTTFLIVGTGEIILRTTGNTYYLNGLRAIALGLFFYPLNKTLTSHLNGLQRIRTFSVFFAGRFILLFATALCAAFVYENESLLPWTISITELFIFVFLILSLRAEFHHKRRIQTFDGITKAHILFGRRGLIGGVLLDLNTRIDILTLGIMSGSRSVGIYSIASLFAEGLYQLAMVARYSFDPVVTKLHTTGQTDELHKTIRLVKRRVYLLMTAIIAMANLVYLPFAQVLFGEELARESRPIFAILTIGLLLTSGYVPFTNLPQQIGEPKKQSKLLASISLTNLLLNIALIPTFGPAGAAAATALSQISLIPYMRRLSAPTLGFRP
jgi:O-antigen/teichoic acid export membrane protein